MDEFGNLILETNAKSLDNQAKMYQQLNNRLRRQLQQFENIGVSLSRARH